VCNRGKKSKQMMPCSSAVSYSIVVNAFLLEGAGLANAHNSLFFFFFCLSVASSQKNIPATEPGNSLAVKVIYKADMMLDYFELPAEERAKKTKEEQAEWDADVIETVQKWLHPLFKETYVHMRLNDHPHVLKYVDHFWSSTKRKEASFGLGFFFFFFFCFFARKGLDALR